MRYVTGTQVDQTITLQEATHRKLAYEAACESLILLENDGTLPLSTRTVALYGPGAKYTIKGGGGSGEVNERYSVTIYEGLKDAGFQITSESYLNDYDVDMQAALKNYEETCRHMMKNPFRMMDLINVPFMPPAGRLINEGDVLNANTDTAIYVLSRTSGENGDRSLEEFQLTSLEIAQFKFLCQHFKHTIFILNTGSPMDLSPLDDLPISAIIYYGMLGEEGGHALADLLSGQINPSGKLSDTWVKSYDDVPYGADYLTTQDPQYIEGIYVGYRYFDTFKITPHYPFGHGLSYTSFLVKAQEISLDHSQVQLPVDVFNTGQMKGQTVIQLYVSCPHGRLDKEYQRLVAFTKTPLLDPNEATSLTLTFDLQSCASFDESRHAYILEKGDYLLRLGESSADTTMITILELEKTILFEHLASLCPLAQPLDTLKAPSQFISEEEAPRTRIPSDAFKQNHPSTFQSPESELFIDDECLQLCIGQGIKGMFDGKYHVTPGAVGKTHALLDHDLLPVNLSDGPAGLRLMRRSSISGGYVKMGDDLFAFMKYVPSLLKKPILSNAKKEPLRYQFATAFPVAVCLAQTWNVDLVERIGEAISKEMSTYLVTYFLAPALNIHRNPLCGRHFEYYSEDPLLSGKMAAAMVKGIQSIDGHYATIKHFACNNQENNRNVSNSILNERTLREIYLKGFEICIKESHPKALMTSYNKINGIYTTESHDLLEKLLRQEWCYEGIVMTDWYATKKGQADPISAIEAGTDLIMPGSGYERKALKKALRKNPKLKKRLHQSASRLAYQIRHGEAMKRYPSSLFQLPKSE